ncbi:hypothetical protein F7725_000394 [Dissostichus mawsoni]|uniref:CIDE-N domain-containing protein n=1 Tax=Dissostichus mawsoni TaxID=36200 RepID=A0A7J5ZGM6_DISMA|nr:hypothetical protein F7725_000394 [Dissostichus mawsoni]
MFGLFGNNKPVKIRSRNENKKYGVAAKDVKELLKKGCKLLQLPSPGAHVCLYSDGTTVTEEFFQTLPDHTELLLKTDRYADGLIEAAKGLLSDEKSPQRRKILTDLLLNLEDRSELESREEHEEWFKGVDDRFKTKSAYMKFNCEGRMRGYMKEVHGATKTIQKAKVREEFLKTSKSLSEMLKTAKNNGCYFDRTEKERLCTREGWFTCQGSYEQKVCQSLHSINPYGSRESRINHKSSDINLNYFYGLLFTRENLKLVHIVCHKKGAHNLLCDAKKIFRKASDTNKAKQNVKGKKRRLV